MFREVGADLILLTLLCSGIRVVGVDAADFCVVVHEQLCGAVVYSQ